MVGEPGGRAVSDQKGTLPKAYFDDLFARDTDPWGLKSRLYERDKYQDTLAALEGRRFRSGLEIGCASGELSAVLSPACDAYMGVDIAEEPLRQARIRNPEATFRRLTLPDETPQGRFDLIVLSEVLYYFSPKDVVRLARWVTAALEPGGTAILVHWLGETPDYPQSGDEAVDAFLRQAGSDLTTGLHRRRALYRIDRLDRRPSAG